MKNLIWIMILGFLMIGCGGASKEATQKVSKNETVQIEEPVKESTSHLCGAATKDGKKCTRKVSNEHGLNALCFQHRAK